MSIINDENKENPTEDVFKEKFVVDVKTTIWHKIPSGGNVSHQMRIITVEDINVMDRCFPGFFLKRQNGKIESPSDLNARKILLYDRTCEKISGYWFSEKKDVPPLDKIKVINAHTSFTLQTESEIDSDFGPEFVKNPENGFICVYAYSNQGVKSICHRFVLKQPEIKDVNDFDRINAWDQELKGSSLRFESRRTADGLVNLFNTLCTEAYGYKTEMEDKSPSEIVKSIPVLHKMNVIRYLFEQSKDELEIFEGNL